jgi:transcriptional regulatory protein RtcR
MPYDIFQTQQAPSEVMSSQAGYFNIEGLALSELTTCVVFFSVAQLDPNGSSKSQSSWLTNNQSEALDQLTALNRPVKARILVPTAHPDEVRRLTASLRERHPSVDLECNHVPIESWGDYGQVYRGVRTWLAAYPWQIGTEEYFGDISTGTALMRSAMMQMMVDGVLPGRAVQLVRGVAQILDILATQMAANAAVAPAIDLGCLFQRAKPEWSIKSAPPSKIRERINLAIKTGTDPVLLLGDTGTGKTWLANEIAIENKKTCKEVNCATIHGDSAKSELFGHTKGAFTGAVSDRKGLLEEANDGILILDEIGELGVQEQGMLLKAIEEKWFIPLGGSAKVPSSFTLIACTNKNLVRAVAEGTFRHDLLERLSSWTFRLPSLAESKDGIPEIVQATLQKFNTENKQSRTIGFDPKARSAFLTFATDDSASWPGNLRELRTCVRRMATMATITNNLITLDIVNEEVERLKDGWTSLHAYKSGQQLEPVTCSPPIGNEKYESGILYPNLLALVEDAGDKFEPSECIFAESLINACLAAKTQEEAVAIFMPRWYNNSSQQGNSKAMSLKIKRALGQFGLTWKMLDQLRSQ